MEEVKEILKQYVIVPKKPKMSPGKIASQVAHAVFMALRKQDDYVSRIMTPGEDGMCCGYTEWDNIDKWEKEGMTVIVLKCKKNTDLLSISKYLEQWNIPHHLYIDEGVTEVDPLSPTALATGVIPPEHQWMFSRFKLYK